jgi:hypothetical protein
MYLSILNAKDGFWQVKLDTVLKIQMAPYDIKYFYTTGRIPRSSQWA